MEFHISLNGRRRLAGQIYSQIRAAISDGRLPPEQAVPSTRELASRLMVSRNTVGVGAYGDPAGHRGLRAAIARHIGW